MLLRSCRSSAAQSFVNDRIGPFAEKLNLPGWRPDDNRHTFTIAAKLEDVQQLITMFHAFGRNLFGYR